MTLPDWMTAAESMEYYEDFFADFRKDAAEEMIASLGLDKNMQIKTMSKGTKEKLQLILTMSRSAKIYLLDEPIGSLVLFGEKELGGEVTLLIEGFKVMERFLAEEFIIIAVLGAVFYFITTCFKKCRLRTYGN